MITFFMEAELILDGKAVHLKIYRGNRVKREQLGDGQVFTREEWEAYRRLLVAGMRSKDGCPAELMDGTRRVPGAKSHLQTR